MLTRAAILESIATGDIVIEPLVEANINPNSVDLRLGPTMLLVQAPQYGAAVNRTLGSPDKTEPVIPDTDGGFLLFPGNLYLGATLEYTETRNLVPVICGKSSVGRKGVFVHVTAGFGDTGFCGNWTLEILTTYPIKLYTGDRICQLHYHPIEGEPTPYAGRYQGDREPSAAKAERVIPFEFSRELTPFEDRATADECERALIGRMIEGNTP